MKQYTELPCNEINMSAFHGTPLHISTFLDLTTQNVDKYHVYN